MVSSQPATSLAVICSCILPADEDNLVAAPDFFDRRYVHHDLVHRHAPNDRATRRHR